LPAVVVVLELNLVTQLVLVVVPVVLSIDQHFL
jgi:hypothetical protein